MLLSVLHDTRVRNHGTVVLVEGVDKHQLHHWFAAEPRLAADLVNAAIVEGEVTVQVENWQLWGQPWTPDVVVAQGS